MTQLGPTKTWSPIFTWFGKWDLSWIIEKFPISIPFVPINVAPYQTEEWAPKFTLPRIVAFGAINYAFSKLGEAPLYVRFLKLGTSRS